jgi:hypothetical protein
MDTYSNLFSLQSAHSFITYISCNFYLQIYAEIDYGEALALNAMKDRNSATYGLTPAA